MSSPSVDLRWGVGFEEIDYREAVRHKIAYGAECAVEGLQTAGLELDRTIRITSNMGERGTAFAQSTGAATIHLYFLPSYVKKGMYPHWFIAASLFHDMLHCIRRGVHNPQKSMLEMAASEGISYVAERDFTTEYFTDHGIPLPKKRTVDEANRVPSVQKSKLRRTFLMDALGSENGMQQTWDKWFARREDGQLLGAAERVGIHAVTRLVETGWTQAEIMNMHAMEILGIE